jgi:hypothetical protein
MLKTTGTPLMTMEVELLRAYLYQRLVGDLRDRD